MNASRLRTRRSAVLSAAVPLALVAIAVLLGASGTTSFEGIVALALSNLIIVLGLQVFVGNSGVYSFGQLGFSMSGAYLAALLTIPATFAALQTPGLPSFAAHAELGPLPATLIAAVGSACLALVIGLPLMRTSTLAIPISTFAFLIVAYNVVANWDALTGGSGGLVSIPTPIGVVATGLWAALAILVALAFKGSASGYRLQATREDEVAARSLGIGVLRERMIAFALSAGLCGIGGALAVQHSGVLTPDTFYFAATVTTLTMLVVGGTRSVFGATVGALAVTVVNEVLRQFEEGNSILGLPSIGETPGLAAIGVGLILLLTMIAMPDGLTGGREAGEIFRRRRKGALAVAPPTPERRRRLRRDGQPRGGSPAGPEEERGLRSEGGSGLGRIGERELIADGISLAFGGLQVLCDVDLKLRRGEALGLIGPNGAGKTTLVNVISGFQRPDAGRVFLDGAETTGWSAARLARAGLVRSFQAALPFRQMSCLESIAVGAMGVGASRRDAAAEAWRVLGLVGLSGEAGRLAGSLPAGSQRLLGIARALATKPSYLLLDEPAAGLNEHESAELVQALRGIVADFNCGLLLIDHDMSVVMDLCSQVQVLDEGRTVAFGTPEEVQVDPAVIESYLGSAFPAVSNA